MAVTIELNEKLAGFAGGIDRIDVEASTVQDAVIALAKLHRPVGARIFNCEGELRNVVRVEVNGQPVPAAQATTTPVSDGDTIKLAFP